eukprot:1883057-Rhodomonas_salina.1
MHNPGPASALNNPGGQAVQTPAGPVVKLRLWHWQMASELQMVPSQPRSCSTVQVSEDSSQPSTQARPTDAHVEVVDQNLAVTADQIMILVWPRALITTVTCINIYVVKCSSFARCAGPSVRADETIVACTVRYGPCTLDPSDAQLHVSVEVSSGTRCVVNQTGCENCDIYPCIALRIQFWSNWGLIYNVEKNTAPGCIILIIVSRNAIV